MYLFSTRFRFLQTTQEIFVSRETTWRARRMCWDVEGKLLADFFWHYEIYQKPETHDPRWLSCPVSYIDCLKFDYPLISTSSCKETQFSFVSTKSCTLKKASTFLQHDSKILTILNTICIYLDSLVLDHGYWNHMFYVYYPFGSSAAPARPTHFFQFLFVGNNNVHWFKKVNKNIEK
jgi:hypothetical protein